MAEPLPTTTLPQQKRRGVVPPELVDLLVPPLKFGFYTGVGGTLLGVGGGIIKDVSPVISGIMTGVHWFSMGTTYWFSRVMVFRGFGGEAQMSSWDKVQASTIAGIPTGIVSGLATRNARTIPSQMLLWALICGGGQFGANKIMQRGNIPQDDSNSWLRSSWSPLKRLTNEEYENMMDEKILRIDADIALVDDRIALLREKQKAEDLGQ